MSIDEVMLVAEDYSMAVHDGRDADCGRLHKALRTAIAQHVAEAVARERVTVLDEVLRGLRSERDTNQLRAIIAEVEAIRARAGKETK